MRALFYCEDKPLRPREHYLLTKDEAHHFLRVLRLKDGDQVLMLSKNEPGFFFPSRLLLTDPKRPSLEILNKEKSTTELAGLNFWCAHPGKKEALDFFSMAIEMGLTSLSFIKTQFSEQPLLELPEKRFLALEKSAREQSNNCWPMHLTLDLSLKELMDKKLDKNVENETFNEVFNDVFKEVFIFHPSTTNSYGFKVGLYPTLSREGQKLAIMGPAAGFSEQDLQQFKVIFPNAHLVAFPTPILRATHAFGVIAGFLLGKIL